MSDPAPDPKPANPTKALRPAGLQVSPHEYPLDQLLDTTFTEKPLPFLTSNQVFFEGASHLLAAREKVGKTTVTRVAAHAWATEGRRVLYITRRGPPPKARDRLRHG